MRCIGDSKFLNFLQQLFNLLIISKLLNHKTQFTFKYKAICCLTFVQKSFLWSLGIARASFIILYRIPGQIQPGEYDYTHEYIAPKK